MKNTLWPGLMSLLFLSIISCGKSVDKVIKSVGKDLGKQIECGAGEAGAHLAADFAQDYDVRLYKSTVDKVLADLRVVKYLDPKDFWSFLSDETRNLLNYELNIHMIKNRNENPAGVYQATAYFFTAVRDLFQAETDYKLRDMARMIYSFSLRGVKSNRFVMLNSKCGKYNKTDLAAITIDDILLKVDSVSDVYECRTLDNKSFTIMDGSDRVYLNTNKNVKILKLNGYKKEINKQTIKLKYSGREISFDIKIHTKREEMIKDWKGFKSKIDFNSTDLSIDGRGACASVKNIF